MILTFALLLLQGYPSPRPANWPTPPAKTPVVIDDHTYLVQYSIAEVAEVPLTNTSTRPHGYQVLIQLWETDGKTLASGATHFYADRSCAPPNDEYKRLARIAFGFELWPDCEREVR
jgi:hypothetical protein